MKLGENIKMLRKQRNISQEVLAEGLGVSFQTVSKWENEYTLPDVSLIPALASFFGVSIDELFDFNLFEKEKQVKAICNEAYRYRHANPEKSEQILRDGLKRFPGNDVILNNLLYTMEPETRADEMITICKALIESTKDDEVKYDAYRILASCYYRTQQTALVEHTLEMIPEIYFTKLELAASLLDGQDSYKAAQKQKNISAETLVNMLIVIARRLKEKGEPEKAAVQLDIARKVIDAFQEDFLEEELFHATIYEYMDEKREEIEKQLKE